MITAGEVTMTNITFDGQNKEANFNLVSVMYATLNLNEGTTIQNNILVQILVVVLVPIIPH